MKTLEFRFLKKFQQQNTYVTISIHASICSSKSQYLLRISVYLFRISHEEGLVYDAAGFAPQN